MSHVISRFIRRDLILKNVLVIGEPCTDATTWLASLQEKTTLRQAYLSCPRGSWLAWVAVYVGNRRRDLNDPMRIGTRRVFLDGLREMRPHAYKTSKVAGDAWRWRVDRLYKAFPSAPGVEIKPDEEAAGSHLLNRAERHDATAASNMLNIFDVEDHLLSWGDDRAVHRIAIAARRHLPFSDLHRIFHIDPKR